MPQRDRRADLTLRGIARTEAVIKRSSLLDGQLSTEVQARRVSGRGLAHTGSR